MLKGRWKIHPEACFHSVLETQVIFVLTWSHITRNANYDKDHFQSTTISASNGLIWPIIRDSVRLLPRTMPLFSSQVIEHKQMIRRKSSIVPACVIWLSVAFSWWHFYDCVAGSFLCFPPSCISATWPTGRSQQAEMRGWTLGRQKSWLRSLTF